MAESEEERERCKSRAFTFLFPLGKKDLFVFPFSSLLSSSCPPPPRLARCALCRKKERELDREAETRTVTELKQQQGWLAAAASAPLSLSLSLTSTPSTSSSSLSPLPSPQQQKTQLNLAHKKTPNDIWTALEAACPSEGDGSIVPSGGGGRGGGGGSVVDASVSAPAPSAGGASESKGKKRRGSASSSSPPANRRVRIGPGALNPLAAGNAVRTAKYNPVTFLPLFLFSMFSRAAYLYFLSQAALAWWSTVSPFAPFGPTLALSFVLAVAALKAAAEDRTRAAEDRRTNGSPARVVLPDGSLLETRWRHVKVGDVLEVRDGVSLSAVGLFFSLFSFFLFSFF